ncbi:beta-galactosidase trimerization domain-containing protein [Thermococcus zilligii]|uniref:beta-galactosidase trimerization domain-containing protein n=1 Tax=Thermococcus zilligii TaxID=54076 RepID=UPI0005953D39|nr:beta-galactosidase trimerization domain-containing protein [Thermococcus zilligii]
MTMRRVGLLALKLIIFLLLVSPPALGSSIPRILVVCSDVEDVMMANSMDSFAVDILYLGKDLPDDRALLSNLEYLAQYDEIWIPDLNLPWTYGGKLSQNEIDALKQYAEIGGVLVLGLNTYVQHWSRELDEILGVSLLRIKSSGDVVYINYSGKLYPYNTSFQIAVVRPVGADVIASYSTGEPAITEAHYGKGVVVLMTFNPVKAVVEQDENYASIYKDVAMKGLNGRASKPGLSTGKVIELKVKRLTLNPIFIGLMAFALLFLMAYLGYLPWGLTLAIVALTFPVSMHTQRKLQKKLTDVLEVLAGATLRELSEELGVEPKRLKFPVAVLKISRKAEIIDLSEFGEGDVLVTLRGKEIEGVAAWAADRYSRLMEKVTMNPGIRVLDLARSLNMPPYDVLETLKHLSKHGVVELRKIMFDYEVYPTKALARWFEV